MLRRAALSLLVLALLPVGTARPGPAEASPQGRPPDVPAHAPYLAAVKWAIGAGIVPTFADGTFRPKSPSTRAQVAVALWGLAGRPTDVPPSGLADVPPDASYRAAVDWAVDRRVIPRRTDGTFRPERSVRRATVALALWRSAGSPSSGAPHPFADIPGGAPYRAAVDWVVDRGILPGFGDGTFRPDRSLNRARMTLAVYRLHLDHEGGPPNVVVILTDDQTLESMRVMPRVQALLADEGTTFSNYVDTFPLCCPARATLLTGQYAHNHHVVNNIAVTAAPNAPIGGSGALDHTNTLATWLHDGGYQTAHVGKYLNCWANNTTPCRAGTPAVPPGWDDWFGLIDPYPANYDYFSFDALDNTQTRHFGPAADIYQTDVLADRAVADIEHMAARQQPFFLNIWPQAPHAGGGTTAPNAFSPAPAPRHTNLFTTETPPAGPAVGETDVSDKPAYIRCTFGLTPNDPPGPGCPNPPTATWTATGLAPTYRATLQSLQAVDELVARVVDTLATTGELDNTVIIYTSDNGYTFGEHRLNFRKIVPYEESVHVPLIIRGPGFPAGHTAPQPTANIDIAPTIVDLTGVTAQRTPDGRPLLPIAQNPTTATNRAILLEDWPTGTFTGIPPHYDAVRTPTDVYIQYATGENEYYDLTNDPHQLTSLHNDPTTTTRRTTLTTLINQLKTCAGPTCQLTAPP